MKRTDQATRRRKQAEAFPLTGIVPPVETRFRPGVSGNPAGRSRKSVTLFLINDLAAGPPLR